MLRTLAFLSLAFASLLEGRAGACGAGLVSDAAATVDARAQRIFLSVRGSKTEIVVQVVVPRSPGAYGALIPLPSTPTVDPTPVDAGELATLDLRTRVTIRTPSSGGGCLCGSTLDAAGGDKGGGVEIASVDIGPLTAVVLDGQSAAAVNGWLAGNGFAIPAADAALIDRYAGAGRAFVALRRNASAGAAPDAIGVHLSVAGDFRSLPLPFTRLGAGPRLAFTLFLAAPSAAGPAAPFAALTLPDLSSDRISGAGYAEAVADAVAARGGRAFVAERLLTLRGGGADPELGPQLAALVDPGQRLVRWSAIVARTDLESDVVFSAAAPASIPSEVEVASAAPARRTRGALALGAPLLLVLTMRRRRRPGLS